MTAKFNEYFYDAEDLYAKKGKTLKEISGLLGVSEKTLCRWAKDGDWHRKRKDYLTSTHIGPADLLKSQLYEMLKSKKRIDPSTADAVFKILASIEKIEGGRDTLGMTIEVMDRFTRFIRQREEDEAFIEKLSGHVQAFFHEVKNFA